MAPDPLTAELDAIRDRAAHELAQWKLSPEPSAGIHMSAHDIPCLLAAVEDALKVHAPVPVYEIAWHGHAPDPGACSVLHCGHPASSLEDDRHAESGDGDWICLDSLYQMACEGCRDETGELKDFADCATRAAITTALLGQDSPEAGKENASDN